MELPDIKFCETDTAEVERSIILAYETITGKKLYPADPVRLFLLSLAEVIILQRIFIDRTGKQNLLAFAENEKLDHLGALTATKRLEAQKAITELRFYLDTPADADINIPLGTLAGIDSELSFETIEEAFISIGKKEVIVKAQCIVPGEIGNGFLSGQINKIITPIDGVESVENISTSFNGAEIETDEHFRERIQLSPEKYSTAGTKGAYKYFVKTVHQDISDISVTSFNLGVVNIYVLLSGGRLPGISLLDKIERKINKADIIPLTDTCIVNKPEVVDTNVDIVWYLSGNKSQLASTIQRQIKEAVEKFKQWQCEKLGRDINPTELIYLVKSSGACRVEVKSPVYKKLSITQVVSILDVKIEYGGME